VATSGKPRYSRWTAREDAIIVARYPAGGVEACRKVLRDRTTFGIQNRAYFLGLHRDNEKLTLDHRPLAAALGAPLARAEIVGARLVKRLT